jgi:hypothetical protein
MVELPDRKLLKAIQERDAERTERIRFQRAAHALRLQVGQLRRQLQHAAINTAAVTNQRSRERIQRLTTDSTKNEEEI